MTILRYVLAIATILMVSFLAAQNPDAQTHKIKGEPRFSKHAYARDAQLPGTYSALPSDHVVGSPTAPVEMIVYASVTCPHCADWFTHVWPGFKRDFINTGKARMVFREYPTSPRHLALAGFHLANCAPAAKFMTSIEYQMREQANILAGVQAQKGVETYLAVAKLSGINTKTGMDKCISDVGVREKINHSVALAQSGKIASVPNFIIAGKTYKGKTDFPSLAKYVDGLLQKRPAPKRRR